MKIKGSDTSPWLNIHTHGQHRHKDEHALMSCSPRQTESVLFEGRVPVTAGVHPWNAEDNDVSEQLELLDRLASNKDVVAIGESGLDRASEVDFKKQEAVFLKQALIAGKAGKPMIIHSVRSFPDIIRYRKGFSDAPPWVIHGFRGNATVLTQLLGHGFYISLGPVITRFDSSGNNIISRPVSSRFRTAVESVPVDRLFFETDMEDIPVAEVYAAFSRFRGIDPGALKDQVMINFRKVFQEETEFPDRGC